MKSKIIFVNGVQHIAFPTDDRLVLKQIVKEIILYVLDKQEGHRLYTAKELGIGIRTLQRKLKEWRGE